jgi:hypothetical protein
MGTKVWVVQEGKNDYAFAEEFGEVEFVTKGDLRSMRGEQNKEVEADIRSFKSNYIAGKDYIIPVGNPMVVAMLTMSLGGGDHKFLKWDGRRAAYIPFTISKVS